MHCLCCPMSRSLLPSVTGFHVSDTSARLLLDSPLVRCRMLEKNKMLDQLYDTLKELKQQFEASRQVCPALPQEKSLVTLHPHTAR